MSPAPATRVTSEKFSGNWVKRKLTRGHAHPRHSATCARLWGAWASRGNHSGAGEGKPGPPPPPPRAPTPARAISSRAVRRDPGGGPRRTRDRQPKGLE